MNNDISAFPVMLRGLQALKREKQQLRRAQRKAVERVVSDGVCFRLWMSDVGHAVCCRKRGPCW